MGFIQSPAASVLHIIAGGFWAFNISILGCISVAHMASMQMARSQSNAKQSGTTLAGSPSKRPILGQGRVTKSCWSPHRYGRLVHRFLTSSSILPACAPVVLKEGGEAPTAKGEDLRREHAFTTILRLTSRIPNYSHSFIWGVGSGEAVLSIDSFEAFSKFLATRDIR